jgi:hypothetical protein
MRARPAIRCVVRAIAPALLTASAAGCDVLDPKVGLLQESCGVDAVAPGAASGEYGGAGTTTSSAYGASSGTSTSSTVTVCAPDAGGTCDECESQFCCTTRTACYEDPVCICADQALERCLKATAPGDDSGIDACWDAFEENGTVEAERVACEKTWCQGPCGVP